MEAMDTQKAERVWSRVMGTQNAAAERCAQETESSLPPQKLLSLIRAERNTAACYRKLACMLSGCARKTLFQMAEQELCHAKKFAALYFLATGKKACVGKAEGCCVTCVNDSLRQLYRQELNEETAYRELAGQAGERACTMQQIADDEHCHAGKIYQILQGIL